MNGAAGIEKGCLLVSVAIGPRTAIVNVLNCSGIQNLEPNRTILFSTRLAKVMAKIGHQRAQG